MGGSGLFPYLYVAVGLVTALLFLTRAAGILGLIVCLAIIGIGRAVYVRKVDEGAAMAESRRSRQPLALCAIVVVSFAAVWFSYSYMSWRTIQELRITASPWGDFSLLFGTNFDSKGRYNVADLELAGYLGGDRWKRIDASKVARKIAIERITDDPFRFARFALSDKVIQLWGNEHNLYGWASGDRQRGDKLSLKMRNLSLAGLDGVYRTTLLLLLVILVRETLRPSYLLALGVVALMFSLPHLFLEVQPRYHLAMTPFIIVASALLVLDFQKRRDEWLSMASLRVRQWLDR